MIAEWPRRYVYGSGHVSGEQKIADVTRSPLEMGRSAARWLWLYTRLRRGRVPLAESIANFIVQVRQMATRWQRFRTFGTLLRLRTQPRPDEREGLVLLAPAEKPRNARVHCSASPGPTASHLLQQAPFREGSSPLCRDCVTDRRGGFGSPGPPQPCSPPPRGGRDAGGSDDPRDEDRCRSDLLFTNVGHGAPTRLRRPQPPAVGGAGGNQSLSGARPHQVRVDPAK